MKENKEMTKAEVMEMVERINRALEVSKLLEEFKKEMEEMGMEILHDDETTCLYTNEQLAEMRATYGTDVYVTNVLTGERVLL